MKLIIVALPLKHYCFTFCFHSHFKPILSLRPFLFRLLSFRCADSGCPTHRAIFVDYVYTLTDGPSCLNVLLLLGDAETPCQLLLQAD